MGTHPNGPAKVRLGPASVVPLKDFLGHELPFLFKVLSVGKALSIQAHPDMQLARELHARSPKLYADPLHKPEMVTAVTDFQVMCAFRPAEEIVKFLQHVPGRAALPWMAPFLCLTSCR